MNPDLISLHQKIDKSFYDSTLSYNWDMNPIDRSFDPATVQRYLSKLNPDDRAFIERVLNNTMYIRYHEFKEALLKSFDKFKTAIGQESFYLLLPSGKIGSEHWLVALLWPQLRNLNLHAIIDEFGVNTLDAKINILIVDDAVYSGNNTLSKIDETTYDMAKHLNTTQEQIGNHFHFHIVIPYTSPSGKEEIEKFCKERNIRCTIYNVYYLTELTVDNTDEDDLESLYNKFGIEFIGLPPVYFDHKIAGPQSTYSTIYLDGRLPGGSNFGSLFKALPSREKINELASMLN